MHSFLSFTGLMKVADLSLHTKFARTKTKTKERDRQLYLLLCICLSTLFFD